MKNNNNNKVSDSIINRVVVKHWNSSDNEYDRMHVEHDMRFGTFLDYVDNISTIAEVNWSVDFLNPDDTSATVYVTF